MQFHPAVLVFAALFALAGYQEARRFHREYGNTPWNWEPLVWAIVLFLSWLIGIVLLAIAERQGRNASARRRGGSSAGYGQTAFAGGAGGSGQVYSGYSINQPTTGQTMTAASASAGPPTVGFWAADPSGRHHYRWWDGQHWTVHVATNGVVTQEGQ